jgi:hypothetical protein
MAVIPDTWLPSLDEAKAEAPSECDDTVQRLRALAGHNLTALGGLLTRAAQCLVHLQTERDAAFAVLARISTEDCDATGGRQRDLLCDCVPCSAARLLAPRTGARR